MIHKGGPSIGVRVTQASFASRRYPPQDRGPSDRDEHAVADAREQRCREQTTRGNAPARRIDHLRRP